MDVSRVTDADCSHGDANRHTQPCAVDAGAEIDGGIVQLGDALDDRHAEAAARLTRATSPIEAIENAFPLFRRQAGAGIAHADETRGSLGADGQPDTPALGRVTQGI